MNVQQLVAMLNQLNQEVATLKSQQASPPDASSNGSSTGATINTPAESRKQVLPKPDKYDGDRDAYPIWKTLMKNKMRIDGAAMNIGVETETAYLSSFLNSKAAMYMQPHQARIAQGEMRAGEFWNTMDARYDDTHRAKRAGIEFDHLKQGNKPFIEFISELERLSSEAGYDNWPAEVKINKLEPKLSSELRQIAITGINTEDTATYARYVRKLHDLDNRLKSARLDGAFKYSLTGNRRQQAETARPPTPPPQRTLDPDAMEWTTTSQASRAQGSDKRQKPKAISQKELKARKNAKACFHCGASEHWAKDCYYSRPEVKTRVNKATTKEEPPKIVEHAEGGDDESENE